MSSNVTSFCANTTLTALIRNLGTVDAPQSTLRWYRSDDSTLETNADEALGTETVSSLSAGASNTIDKTVVVPDTVGTYYYFACVDQVTREVDTGDNCSPALIVEVTVHLSSWLASAQVRGNNVATADTSVTLLAVVSNTGKGGFL